MLRFNRRGASTPGELNHALSPVCGPTQSQLSRPISSRHDISMEHRPQRKQLQFNSDIDASNEAYLTEIQEKTRRNNFSRKCENEKRDMKNKKAGSPSNGHPSRPRNRIFTGENHIFYNKNVSTILCWFCRLLGRLKKKDKEKTNNEKKGNMEKQKKNWKNRRKNKKNRNNPKCNTSEDFEGFWLQTQNLRRFPVFAVVVVTFLDGKSSTVSMFFSECVSFPKKNQQPILGSHSFFSSPRIMILFEQFNQQQQHV